MSEKLKYINIANYTIYMQNFTSKEFAIIFSFENCISIEELYKIKYY